MIWFQIFCYSRLIYFRKSQISSQVCKHRIKGLISFSVQTHTWLFKIDSRNKNFNNATLLRLGYFKETSLAIFRIRRREMIYLFWNLQIMMQRSCQPHYNKYWNLNFTFHNISKSSEIAGLFTRLILQIVTLSKDSITHRHLTSLAKPG